MIRECQMNLYKWQDASGRTIYSDRMPATNAHTGSVANIRNGKATEVSTGPSHSDVKSGIKAAAKHIPKAQIYLDYIE